ncbi:hypothetical protein TREPR_2473 [Treponema primitia ZAS-2]|uniref:Uncharacterized protein n=1 Tax=Treponema primitia (strain ATCC BAA-887 / DSM 12427 / ZAS-2) TaxID=545694 RepID=F5YH31_TREPZ|nr:hypothetical protein TREPR_2473 [Treponema primitia ZAS-2]
MTNFLFVFYYTSYMVVIKNSILYRLLEPEFQGLNGGRCYPPDDKKEKFI